MDSTNSKGSTSIKIELPFLENALAHPYSLLMDPFIDDLLFVSLERESSFMSLLSPSLKDKPKELERLEFFLIGVRG